MCIYKKINILFFVILFIPLRAMTQGVDVRDSDIKKYCLDMTLANPGANSDFYKRCVGTLEVQKKYRDKAIHEKRMEEDARRSEDYDNKMTYLLDQAGKSNNPAEKNMILIELNSMMKECENYFDKVVCDINRSEIGELSNLKGFKRDVEKPVPPWVKNK